MAEIRDLENTSDRRGFEKRICVFCLRAEDVSNMNC